VIIRPTSSLAQDRESLPVKDQRSTTVLRRQQIDKIVCDSVVFLLLLLLDNQQTPMSWDITVMTRCRGSELRQAIPEDVQGITLDSRPTECIPLRNCAREERVLAL